MTIRVLIEREVEPGQEIKLQQILSQARTMAMKTKGYISGETLRAVDNPNKFVVISNWNSLEDWKAWEKSAERASLQQALSNLLLCKEKCTVLSHF
ncbi:MAG: antibiotic biosynthesis monooxygenase [Desulfobacteraceae bacterium]|nr:antibiotic biosynthesis monooxygenase [Desulfobacteraceae bacterium]